MRLARAARKSAGGFVRHAVVSRCADGAPSARITDFGRMKSHPSEIGDLE